MNNFFGNHTHFQHNPLPLNPGFPCTGPHQPSLVNETTGGLNHQWVNWYRSKTNATLSEAVNIGTGHLLELSQKMNGFFRELLVNRSETLASFPDNYPGDLMGCSPGYFQAHSGRTQRYVPDLNEPSPFYTTEELNDLARLDVTVEHTLPWDNWFIQKTMSDGNGCTKAKESLVERLNTQSPVCPENMMVQPPLVTATGSLSLLWVLWWADTHANTSLANAHKLGLTLTRTGRFSPPNLSF